jgi:hypothetical protein
MPARINWWLAIAASMAVGLTSGLAGAKDATPPDAGKGAPEKAFHKVKNEYQQHAHNRKPAERIAALKLLEDFPSAEAADLIYITLLGDHSDEVRQAAVSLLASWRDRGDVSAQLLQHMTASTRKDGMDRRAATALRALAGTEDDDLQNRLLKYLDEFLGTPHIDQFLLHEMIDSESPRGDAGENARMLALFARTKFFESHFGFRRCTVQALMQMKSKDALTQLVNLLPRLNGLAQFDAVSHLVIATGQNFGVDAGKWQAWWAQRDDEARENDQARIPPAGSYIKVREYYGIPICSRRVVFVLDTSGSMRGKKIGAAQAELIRAVRDLPADVEFSIIAFDNSVRVWQNTLMPATEEMKQIAVNFVLDQQARNNTASFDALEAAFGLDPEAIYFVSDGAPHGGKIEVPADIVATISKWNRVRRISIHSIGIDTKSDKSANPFSRFMKALAQANWGVYRAVN